MKINKEPKPIFIIGAARNGTTSLCNKLSMLDGVSGVTSKYHYGNCESKILRHKFFWGDLSKYNNFINFIGHLQYSDYFVAANGDIRDVIVTKPKCYFDFYFNLMDNLAISQQSDYWVTKLDYFFFLHPEHFHNFREKLLERYGKNGFKFIWIKRDLKKSLISYLHMEGGSADKRNSSFNRYIALFLQTLRYNFIYKKAAEYSNDVYKINFEEYIINPEESIKKIPFLNSYKINTEKDSFAINTSFNRKKPKGLNKIDSVSISLAKFINKIGLDFYFLFYYQKRNKLDDPFYYREFMHKYFEDQLKKDLQKRKAYDLINELNI